MSKKVMLFITALVVVALLPLSLSKCSRSEARVNPEFGNYISAFTAGTISVQSPIRIILANEVGSDKEFNKPIEEQLFDFSPSIEGTTVWIDSRTIEFRPKEKLPAGQKYSATFHLSKVTEAPKALSDFEFEFDVMTQSFEVYVDGLTITDLNMLVWERLTGALSTADFSVNEDAEKVLTAEQNGKALHIAWEHNYESKTHKFTIDSIRRSEKAGKVILRWNGKALGVDAESFKEVEVPAFGDFKIMDVDVKDDPEQYVLIRFSDPLDPAQNLDGLIYMDGSRFNFTIENNTIRCYPRYRVSGVKNLTVEMAVKNIRGKTLREKRFEELKFEELKPAVKLEGKGVILPNSQGIVLPFQAVNLRAVDVKVIRIFENNIAQFLQVNSLAGNSELKRVGRVVKKKTVKLNPKTELDLKKWNTYYLDLSDLVKTEPGAIYKVNLGFKRSYSAYACSGKESNGNNILEQVPDENSNEDPDDDNPDSYYGYYNDYYSDEYSYYESDYEYSYSDRDNPCTPSYYNRSRDVSRNVLASDLGIIAKKGTSGSMLFVVADLKTTQPLGGVSLELYNYQHQPIGKTVTDAQGMANIDLKKKPFLLVAKKGTQRGYLKLDDGSSLSLSTFDVSGETIEQGIKGFIYGERGVWRPGDSLFLSFILEDKEKVLPPTHPVSFELVNPKGQVVKRMTRTSGLNGFYNFSTSTEREAPTGSWMARVKVGGAMFTKNLKIETIMPNRLKLNLDFHEKVLSVSKPDVNGDLEVKWLMGAVAKNLPAKVEVTLTQGTTAFKGYDDYVFNDPSKTFKSETQTIFDGKLDENGKADVKPDFGVQTSAPGMLNASFFIRVFEEGGNASVDRFTLPYSPFKSYVGIKVPDGNANTGMLQTDTNHIVKVVTVDAYGKPVSKKSLTVQIYKVNWRWWWDRYEEDLGNYVGNEYHQPIQKFDISTINGKGTFVLRVNRPDWGRFLVKVTDNESGHSTGQTVYIDWPAWAGKPDRGDNKGATLLTFTADKPKYNVGDMVNLTIPTGAEGRALVSIETGTKVLEAHWVEAKKGNTNFSFPVKSEMAPNIYVHVTLVQPHAQVHNDLPIRLYGIIPLLVEDPKTHLRPVIQTAEVWKPESKASVTVAEENGKPMTYTIAVVDEGLLDLTRFKTPNPWDYFYAREALGVKTWDLYDDVMGAFGGQLGKLLALGGGDEASGKDGKKANRFKPMVKFMGPFHIGKGEKKTSEFMIPQYVGSVRVMVVAGEDFAYGSNDKTVPVRKPLMILGTLPRVVGPNEEVDLPVTVFAMEKFVKNVSVSVSMNNMFMLEDAGSKNVSFTDIGDEVVTFKLKVAPKLGIGKVKIFAKSSGETAANDIEIDVRNPNPKVTDVIETVIDAGKTWSTEYTPVGMAGTNAGTLEISNIPPIDLGRRLKYLIEYPHGCIEQTTSSAFPQLYLSNIMELNSDFKTRIDQNIRAAINRIRLFMTSSGGFAYWPGENEADEWGSNYAGNFLIEAEAKGFTVPQGTLDNWRRYQKQKANSWMRHARNSYYWYYNEDLNQSYRLYTLALAKTPELGAMNRLKEDPMISLSAKWELAAAYVLAGQPEVAKKLVYNVATVVNEYTEMSWTYGSSDRDEALIAEALTLMGERAKAAPVIKQISTALSDEHRWMSTQTTAYCLMAVSKFAGANGASSESNFAWSINSSAQQTKLTKVPVSQIDMKIQGANKGNVSVVNKGKGILYARIILEGIPVAGEEKEASNDLNMSVTYKKMDGSEIDVTSLEQGTDFYAEVTIANPGIRGQYKEMALTQIFPSGWEIHNTRMDEVESTVKSSYPTYQDIRDDRVYTYFDIGPRETKTYRIILNASYIGKFYLPTVACEAMYDNTVNARKPGQWIEIKKPGGNI